jgi:capsular exopolysaccharide synthesis family protein
MPEQRLASILWRGKYLILISLAVAVGAAIAITKTSKKVYQATAVLQVNSVSSANSSSVNPADVQNASQSLATTYSKLITDPGFLAQIQPRIAGGRYTVGQLENKLSASAVEKTTLLDLNAQGPSPENARQLALQVANAFVRTVKRQSQTQTQQLQAELQARVAQLTRQIEHLARSTNPNSPSVQEQLATLRGARDSLISQQQQLLALGLLAGGSVQLTAPPHASSTPVRPRPVLNLIAGILLGLLIGVGLAYLRARLDRGLHSSDEAEELLGLPILASIPTRRRFTADDPVLGEAYDVLRTNLTFISVDQPLQVVTFSSFHPREGKTSTVEGLAYAAVRGGMNVLVVDGDVRTRTLSGRFGQEDASGLTSIVVGVTSPADAVVEIAPGLSLLAAGPTPPNPPSLLGSTQMAELIRELRGDFSLILVDSPPVSHLADAAILAAVSDGVVVVARVGTTRRADLPAAIAKLRHGPTPVVGAVVLEPRTLDQTYYPARSKGIPTVRDTAETR